MPPAAPGTTLAIRARCFGYPCPPCPRRARTVPFRVCPTSPPRNTHILELWRERQTFARLRAQNADGPTWSFLDGPITANNPMGVHHAWGRTYKDLYQRFHAMLGHDQRWQNGFDCQGLWVEVNVERDLGFTSKRDIEAYGIAEFVSLCKQRVLTYAARQTEQSIRLGIWMDWNDPDELRRLRDLLADDPGRVITVEGPRGPVTDTVEMIVGRLGMPELGGSYFTFSNENNDLIWGFLADCHERGWLYKGHDTMPWCARCGTGLSQMEMNEGYQDREDPGLTIRFPLVDRPGEALLVWTTTPWTLTSNVAAAVGEELTYVARPPGRGRLLAGQGHPQAGPRGSLRGARGAAWPRARRAGATRGRSTSCPPCAVPLPPGAAPTARRPTITASWPGTRSARTRARASSTSRRAAARRTSSSASGWGCRSSRRSTSRASSSRASTRSAGATCATSPSRSSSACRHHGRFYRLETISHRYPHCWRCGTPLIFRLVDEWFISMGEVYDQPRETLTAEQVERSLRYQIMEVVDQIRWIPGFGYERELDWLRNMHDWMISKKRYWGLALPIYDCGRAARSRSSAGARSCGARAVEGWAAFEGHTPHRPYVDAVKIACSGCGAPVARITDVGNPWLDAGIVPFSTLHYREDPEYWARWFPADFITESFPGQFRNWFYSMLAMSTVLRREAPFKTIFGYALVFGEDGRPMHKSWGNAIEFDEAADRMGVDVMRWMFATRAAGGEHPLRLARGRRGAPRAARAVERLRLLRHLRPTGRLVARVDAGASRSTERPRSLDRWILSRAAASWRPTSGRACDDYDAVGAAARCCGTSSTTSRRGTCAWAASGSRARMTRADRAARLRHAARGAADHARLLAPILPFLTEAMYDNLARRPARGRAGQRPPHALARRPSWPRIGTRRLEAAMATRPPRRRAGPHAARRARACGCGSRSRALWLALPGGATLLPPRSCSGSSPTR